MKRVEKNEKGSGWVYLYLSVLSGSRGSINLNLSLSHNLNPAHLVFHFGLDVKNPRTPEPQNPVSIFFHFFYQKNRREIEFLSILEILN